MENMVKIGLVVCALAVTIWLQIRVSKFRWTFGGLILPLLLFLASTGILCQDLRHIRAGVADSLNGLTAVLYFALYNIPTILFLCIYNYYQRMRIHRE